jgi:hypothetical protein
MGTGRVIAAAAALLVLAGATGCGGGRPPLAGTGGANGVRVEVRMDAGSGADGTALVTFTPEQGFHLYSLRLPATGIDGVGRPTRVELTGGLTATGPATADHAEVDLRVAGVPVPMPVYPDGAVTLQLPVRRTGPTAIAVIGYAACSEQVCLPPVSGLAVPLTLP